MKKNLLITILIFIILVIMGVIYFDKRQTEDLIINVPEEAAKTSAATMNMKLSSPAFGQNQTIPAKYTCDGDNISPPLEISGVPERAKSLVLIVDDPDAPSGDWVHWLIWNIATDTASLPEGGPLPEGAVEGTTSFGNPGYGGPCPPSGTHHYYFRLYAIGGDLYLDPSATKKDLEGAIENMVIEKTELVGLYQQQ